MSRKKSQLIVEKLVQNGFGLPVPISALMPYLPTNPFIVVKELAAMGVIANAELYSGPLPVAAAIQLESLGITTRAMLGDEIRSGNLDLSKFNYVGPKKWSAIMKWAQIDPSGEKLLTIRLKLPARVVSCLRDMKKGSDSALSHPTIQYLADVVLDSVEDKTEWQSLVRGRIRSYVDSMRSDQGLSV